MKLFEADFASDKQVTEWILNYPKDRPYFIAIDVTVTKGYLFLNLRIGDINVAMFTFLHDTTWIEDRKVFKFSYICLVFIEEIS